MEDEPNFKEQLETIKKVVAEIIDMIDTAKGNATNQEQIDNMNNIRSAFEDYPPMFEELITNAYVIQGAINDIGVDKFLTYARLFRVTADLSKFNIFPPEIVPKLLVEIMKFCVLQGIKYGTALQKYDSELFSSFVNEL